MPGKKLHHLHKGSEIWLQVASICYIFWAYSEQLYIVVYSNQLDVPRLHKGHEKLSGNAIAHMPKTQGWNFLHQLPRSFVDLHAHLHDLPRRGQLTYGLWTFGCIMTCLNHSKSIKTVTPTFRRKTEQATQKNVVMWLHDWWLGDMRVALVLR